MDDSKRKNGLPLERAKELEMNTFKKLVRVVVTAGVAMVAATAGFAQEPSLWTRNFQKEFMTEKMMHMMDMSGKGMVTKADYDKYMSKVFDMMDKGHKGMLDKSDFTRYDSGSTDIWTTDFQKTFRTIEMMHMMDKGKGMVSKADFMAHMDKIFDSLDKNHDGMLQKDEFMYEIVFGVR
jgi:Ca2+-binding EF-hand superfamily protein